MFDRGAEFPRPSGRAAIAAGSANPEHHRAIEEGIAHFAGLPYVRVDGDTAVAISYLQILVPDRVGPVFEVPNHGSSRGFHVHRVSANRWEFVRTEEGWKISRRTLRPLDGTAPARDILKRALGAGEELHCERVLASGASALIPPSPRRRGEGSAVPSALTRPACGERDG